ncbi:MAG: transglutaminaseTgpA domain-containing protein, partial [Acidimicrobiales bacterium]
SGARGGHRRLMLGAGAALSVVAVVGSSLLGPRLPGASAAALVNWHNQAGPGTAARTTLSPLVDIRAQLLKPSNVEVFTVSSPVRSYWRLTALSTFNGSIWSSDDSYRQVGTRLPGTSGPEPVKTVQETFDITGLDDVWLPAAYRPVGLSLSGSDQASYNAQSASIILSSPTSPGLTYTVESAIPDFSPTQLSTAQVRPNDPAMARYLALPSSVPQRVKTLADQVVHGQTTAYGKALALQDFFRRNFTYSLNVPATTSDNALVRFLFQTRRGFCQQFAGAYAVMARAIGLPSRVAVGFTPGQLGADGLYHVRALNAHAWPEVHLGHYGWVPFEPTPGRGAPGATAYTHVQPQQAGPADARQPVPVTTVPSPTSAPAAANPSRAKIRQLQGGGTAAPASAPARSPSSSGNSGLVAGVIVGLILLLVLGLLPALVRIGRRRRRARARGTPEEASVAFAEAALALARSGRPRHPAETLSRYARRISPHLPKQAGAALESLSAAAGAAAYSRSPAPAAGGSQGAPAVDRLWTHCVQSPGGAGAGGARAGGPEELVRQIRRALHSEASRSQRLWWWVDPRPLLPGRVGAGARGTRAGNGPARLTDRPIPPSPWQRPWDDGELRRHEDRSPVGSLR